MEIKTLSIDWTPERLLILDQTQLPHHSEWIEMKDLETFITAIKKLSIRGAPLIGVASSLFLANLAQQWQGKRSVADLIEAAQKMRMARPTAVNLMVCIDRMLRVISLHQKSDEKIELVLKQQVTNEAINIFQEDVQLCEHIAINGAKFFADGDSIVTHCNTGALATAGIGTALGVIKHVAKVEGKKIHVYVDETRPLLQGARLTAWELEKLEIPYTLVSDSMAAFLMKQGKIQKAIVGCDRIALNGDFANKIGTYSLAVNCNFHQIPFYVAGPYTTVDFECVSGAHIPIEERHSEEVHGVNLKDNRVLWAPKDAKVYNPSFDVTPAELVTAWILDRKVFDKNNISQLKDLR